MKDQYINIEIEHLVLQGIDPRHRHRIADAVRRELTQLVAAGGVPAHLLRGEASPRGTARVEVDAAQPPTRIGASVARAIYQGGK